MTDDLDLSAWDAPPPPPGLADAVLAQMKQPLPIARAVPVRRRGWWLAAAAVVAAVVGLTVLVRYGIERAPTERRVELPRTVPAPRDVPSPPRDVPAVGPLPDSLTPQAIATAIEAVETAVLSCEGYVGRLTATLEVAPDGSVTRVELRPARTPVDACVRATLRAARFDATVRGGPVAHVFSFESEKRRPINVAPSRLRGLLRTGSWDIVPDAATRKEIGDRRVVGSYKLCVTTAGAPSEVRALKRTGVAAFDAAIEGTVRAWRFQPYLQGATAVAVCTAVTVIYQGPCDAEEPRARGIEAFSAGNDAAAVASFEQSLACKKSGDVAMRAFMAACRLRDLARAKRFRRLDRRATEPALVVCVRNGIDPSDLDRP